MNNKSITAFTLLTATLLFSLIAHADIINTNTTGRNTFSHRLSNLYIPEAVGGETWFDDQNQYNKLDIVASGTAAYADITVAGTVVGTTAEGANIYATDNSGIGIAYELNYSTPGATSPQYAYVYPNKLTFNGSGYSLNGYMHLKYALVRLTQFVPAGPITQLPTVTVNYHNLGASGYPDLSVVTLQGISAQPQITACNINAPGSITLPPVNGNSLVEGAQGITDAPQITLTNCPGAINNIIYDFAATYYNTHSYVNGIFTTKQGDGYAKNVYIQLQDATGTGIHINSPLTLPGYTGSGNYAIPNFRIAYFIDSGTLNTVTAGKVETAIDFTVIYN
ncbi:fimbrial protein [[Enterobacter] lignolyticus]|uniref:Fimbrial-type adhesion domain-containing protein n=1 Tax=[Enterobacter] lignolyticus TaxID=1334193 RepID=A0A806X9T0_9ENTR|nr:hypothetical protein [[Enterobacter] lignolyticus]ALR76373.1 hypothetical protein AO703_08715 [[Enterobacter] lignolyticus]